MQNRFDGWTDEQIEEYYGKHGRLQRIDADGRDGGKRDRSVAGIGRKKLERFQLIMWQQMAWGFI